MPGLIDIFAEQEGVSIEDAVKELAVRFNIKIHEPFSALNFEFKHKCFQVKSIQGSPGNCPNLLYIAFQGVNNNILGYAAVVYTSEPRKIIIPVSAWCLSNSYEEYFAMVPFKNVLWNWNLIARNLATEIWLYDSVELAFYAKNDDNVIPTSWIGGRTTALEVNWEILRNRKVVYILHEHSGFLMKNIYETALVAHCGLKNVDGIQLRFLQGKKFMGESEFISNAKSEFGLGTFIKDLMRKAGGRIGAQKDKDFDSGEEHKFLLSPIISEGDTTLLYAGKGLGKTALAMGIAYAVALGRDLFDLWKANNPQKVLYFDSEIGVRGLADRKRSARRVFKLTQDADVPIWFLSERLNLYTEEGRQLVENEIAKINAAAPVEETLKFIVIDNLTSAIGSNDTPAAWDVFYTWVMGLKEQGISVLILFHANDDDSLRGSKMKLINIDNVIFLGRPQPGSGDGKPNKRQKKTEKQPQDRSKISMNIVFENLRNNPYPEAYTTIKLEYSVPNCSWKMLNFEQYMRSTLSSLSEYCSDEEMAKFFGETPRQIKELRRKYDIRKNKSSGLGCDGQGKVEDAAYSMDCDLAQRKTESEV